VTDSSPDTDGRPIDAADAAVDASLALSPAAAVPLVQADHASDTVPLDPEMAAKLDAMVASYLEAVTSLDPGAPELAARATEVRQLGDEDIRAAASVSNRLLESPMGSMTKGGIGEASTISRSLLSLRRTVEDLDPARQGNLLSPRKLFGLVPFGSRLRDYFSKYRSSQGQLNAIINALQSGQAELAKDNTAIEAEKTNLWGIMARLRQYNYLSQKLDAALTAKVAEIEASDPERARVVKEDFLFYVRQKVQDLMTQLAVSVQGYLALDVIRRNNLELIKGVDRATTTTVSALRTAVIVAQALADQKLVLDQITALNTTTSNLIEATSAMLRTQSGQITEQAASSTIEVSKLQAAFDNVHATLDEIDTFRLAALDNMARTIDVLSGQVAKSQAYLDRLPAQGSGPSGDGGSSGESPAS
jgi:uncharacterized protein YaaN involved in tellurite resistance